MGIRDFIRKVDNVVDKAADATIAVNRALTTQGGQTLRGKSADAVRAKFGSKKNRCGNCNAKIADDAITCKKSACIRAMGNEWESMHPEEQKKFVQKSKLRRKSDGWVPPANFKHWKLGD
jgi:hypothetical protein